MQELSNCKPSIFLITQPNTNCLILSKHAPKIPKQNFTCLTRLDLNRLVNEVNYILKKTSKIFKCKTSEVKNAVVWGNHSPTMYPDIRNTTVNGKKAFDLVDKNWIN